jgi:hypothetical protein
MKYQQEFDAAKITQKLSGKKKLKILIGSKPPKIFLVKMSMVFTIGSQMVK